MLLFLVSSFCLGFLPSLHPSLCRTSGLSPTGDRHSPVPPPCPNPLCPRAGLPLGLQSLDQEYGLQGVRKILLCWLSPCWVRDALSQGQEQCWALSRATQGQIPQEVTLGGHRTLSPTLLPSFFSSPDNVWAPPSGTKPPSAGGHCHGHRALHRQMWHTWLRQTWPEAQRS